jgi:cellulose synthase/poly-beta-1,6-N-acetylglucosamine synthase-like glycosyltransferase
MDADTRVNDEYFTSVKESFTDEDVVLVCGQPKSRPHNWLTAHRCFGYFCTANIFREAQSKMGVINVAPGCASTYRTSIFDQLDWSKDTIVEDMDITVQVHRKKLGRIVYQPKAVVYTQDPSTIKDYLKQMFRWHSGTWQVVKKYKMLAINRERIDYEYKLLLGEGLFFSLFYLMMPFLAMYHKTAFMGALVYDFGVTFAIALYAGFSEKRLDVVLWSPIFSLIRVADCGVYLYSFWNTTVRRRRVTEWNSVRRYA